MKGEREREKTGEIDNSDPGLTNLQRGHRREDGRPRKADAPEVPREELERLLVHGEEVAREDGESMTVVYPTYRALAERYGVSHAWIARFSRKHDCMARREEARARVSAQVDDKLTALRSDALAVSKADTLRMIDSYLLAFEQALEEGRVWIDSPSDFNTMVRLREFIQGDADSRQEVRGVSITLEELARRHQALLDDPLMRSPMARGEAPQEANNRSTDTATLGSVDSSDAEPVCADRMKGGLSEIGSRSPSGE